MQLTKIHTDERGEIWILLINGKEHTLLLTKPKYARGGCIHRYSDEYCVVLDGAIEYHIRGRKVKKYAKGDSLFIPRNTPHYFIALEPSFVMEWGPAPEEKKEKCKSWRKKVEKINEEVHSSL